MNFFGSEKYFNNRTPLSVLKLEAELDSRTPKDWFLAPNNREFLKSRIIRQKIPIDEITLASNMAIWAKKNKLEELSNAEYNATENNDYMTILNQNNQNFMNYLGTKFSLFGAPQSNHANIRQYRNSDENMVVQDGILQDTSYKGPVIEKKKYSEMTAEDIRNMDVYDPTYDRDLYAKAIGVTMKRNKFQKTMHKRRVDFDVKELKSSHESLVRRYDMSEFRRNANSSKKPISRYQFQ